MFKIKELLPFIIFIIISILLIFSWFKQGMMYGGAEVGLLTHNSVRQMEVIQHIWWEAIAPGMLVPHFISSAPLFFLLSQFSFLSPVALQASLLLILLLLLLGGSYILALSYLGPNRKKYAFMAAFFYLFNSYMMVAVWHRFLYTSFFLAAFLPILSFLWRLWVINGKLKSLVFFLFVNFLSSYMFGNLAAIVTIWVSNILLTVIEIIHQTHLDKKIFKKYTYRFLIGICTWFITNAWWLLPALFVSSKHLASRHPLEETLSTLVLMSQQSIIPFVLQHANPFYLFYTKELGDIYSSLQFLIIPWIIAAVICYGLMRSLKIKGLASIGVIYVLVIIFSKGSANPFGFFYIWGFSNINFLGLIRNPFEKLGILLPLFGSLLFAIGIEGIIEYFKKKSNINVTKLVFFCVLSTLIVYTHPMFLGTIFNKPKDPVRVEVPDSYLKANEWLKKQSIQGNILHLPYAGNDVVTWNWKNGYHGVDITSILFEYGAHISRTVTDERIDNTLAALKYIFNKKYYDNNQVTQSLLRKLNIQYLFLHKDTVWNDTSTYGEEVLPLSPVDLEKSLDTFPFIEKRVDFSDISIYEFNDLVAFTKVELTNKAQLVQAGNASIFSLLGVSFNQDAITSENNSDVVKSNLSEMIIFPDNNFYSWEPSDNEVEKTIQDSFFKIDNIRKYLNNTKELISLDIIEKIDDAQHHLINGELEQYQSIIKSVFIPKFSSLNINKLYAEELRKIFTGHIYILEKFLQNASFDKKTIIQNTKSQLDTYLKDDLVIPVFPASKKVEEGVLVRKIHKFNVLEDGEYELVINPPTEKTVLQIDGRDYSLSKVFLTKGLHEISFVSSLTESLIFWDKTINLTSIVEFPIKDVKGGDIYQISFNVISSNTPLVYIVVIDDTKIPQNQSCGKSCYAFNLKLTDQVQNFSFRTIPLNVMGKSAFIRLINPYRSNITIHDIKVQKYFNNELYLKKIDTKDKSKNSSQSAILNFKKISPVKYSGRIKNTESNFLIFKESYNSGWKFKVKNNDTGSHYLANFYSNSWFIDQIGEYDFEIVFEPNKFANAGLIISVFFWVTISLLLLLKSIKR